MVSITVPLEKPFKERLESFPWVNWSEIGREDMLKRVIFDKYIKTGRLSDKDWEFCKKIDWHPVDWLPLKEEFKKELESRKKGHFIKLNSVKELFEE